MYHNYGYANYSKEQLAYGHPGYDQQGYPGDHMVYPNGYYNYHEGSQHEHANGYFGSEGQKNPHGNDYGKAFYDPTAFDQQGSQATGYATGEAQGTPGDPYAGVPECGEYGSYQQFYEATHATPTAGDNSNGSSEFHFLSNLANEYGPEYYTI